MFRVNFRPSDCATQKLCYSGHTRRHDLKCFLWCVLLVMVGFFGPYPGSSRDERMLYDSELQESISENVSWDPEGNCLFMCTATELTTLLHRLWAPSKRTSPQRKSSVTASWVAFVLRLNGDLEKWRRTLPSWNSETIKNYDCNRSGNSPVWQPHQPTVILVFMDRTVPLILE